ncbi:hypothetical protein CPB84DRAFT_1849100 [Gymnopilus junonius]|uniref:HMG box domain-containing protein n=1 Tax=Gymnopilus junonius TaxID=109634 RepID=A0A9P5TLP9_GYMJU|nr:hypothetical protein CPB84DRAFT_1849100 [Gymnopilus junonius]
MPAVRLTRRRKSSHATFSPAKPGTYGVTARPVTFAPNITPGTFTEPDPDDTANPLVALAATAADPAAGPHVKALFPNQDAPQTAPSRKRCPPGKRFSQGYIPRPPNAFMLFRADFVKQKHVPGSIEANHSSLSKIIGNYWRSLPPDEKHAWEVKAKHEKAAHKIRFPDYRFRPVHNKNKQPKPNVAPAKDDATSKSKAAMAAEDERRCEEVAQLLLEGKKGDELAKAVQSLDRARSWEREQELEFELEMGFSDEFDGDSSIHSGSLQVSRATSPSNVMPTLHMPTAIHSNTFGFHPHQTAGIGMGMDFSLQRRPSSVPLPNEWFANPNSFMGSGIALPSLPPFISRPASPVNSISRYTQAQNHNQIQFNNPFHTSESQPFAPAEGHHQPQGLFHPHPQHFSPNRASFGLGLRRASSAQPLLWRSQMQMERDPSPLPEVDPGLFGNFSFPTEHAGGHNTPPILAPMDTSVPPLMQHEHDLSSSAQSTSATFFRGQLGVDVLNNGFTGMNLDGLYASTDSAHGMGMGMGDDISMGMGGCTLMSPSWSLLIIWLGGGVVLPQPTQTPTQAEFATQQQEVVADDSHVF